MLEAKKLLLYMPWWFWIYRFLAICFILKEMFNKRKDEPLIILISYLFLPISFMLMMMDMIIRKTTDLVIYSPIVTKLMVVDILIVVILISIGLYQKRQKLNYKYKPYISFTQYLKRILIFIVIYVIIVVIFAGLMIFLKEYMQLF